MDETLGARVLADLRRQLITGVLAPGDRLSLRSVADQQRTSMQPVRDAVARLVAERVLEVTPKSAVQVPLLSAPGFALNFHELIVPQGAPYPNTLGIQAADRGDRTWQARRRR